MEQILHRLDPLGGRRDALLSMADMERIERIGHHSSIGRKCTPLTPSYRNLLTFSTTLWLSPPCTASCKSCNRVEAME